MTPSPTPAPDGAPVHKITPTPSVPVAADVAVEALLKKDHLIAIILDDTFKRSFRAEKLNELLCHENSAPLAELAGLRNDAHNYKIGYETFSAKHGEAISALEELREVHTAPESDLAALRTLVAELREELLIARNGFKCIMAFNGVPTDRDQERINAVLDKSPDTIRSELAVKEAEIAELTERVRELTVYRDICNTQIKDDEKQFDSDAAEIAALRTRAESAERERYGLQQFYDKNISGWKQRVEELDTLRAENVRLQDRVKTLCAEWAEDDTALKEICARHGVAMNGDRSGFKDRRECVDELSAKMTATVADNARLAGELERANGLLQRFVSEWCALRDYVPAMNILCDEVRAHLSPTTPAKPALVAVRDCWSCHASTEETKTCSHCGADNPWGEGAPAQPEGEG